jgi:hypothetical protein
MAHPLCDFVSFLEKKAMGIFLLLKSASSSSWNIIAAMPPAVVVEPLIEPLEASVMM